MIKSVEVSNEMEDVCNVSFATTQQHIDNREYLIRNAADLQILQHFLTDMILFQKLIILCQYFLELEAVIL